MATRTTAGVGLNHVTVVPTNFDPDSAQLAVDDRQPVADRTQ